MRWPPEGAKAEKAYAADGTIPDPESTDNPEFKIVLGLIRDSLKKDPTKWTKYAKALQGTLLGPPLPGCCRTYLDTDCRWHV